MPFFSSVLARRTFGYLAAGAVALLSIVFASLWLADRTREHANEISRARDIRSLDSQLLIDFLDAETGQRGYLLTHSDRYLLPYEKARQRLSDDMGRLRKLMADDPSSSPKIERLAALAGEKLDELAQTIRLENGGQRDESLALVNSDHGLELMDDARRVLNDLIENAEARVAYRVTELDKAVAMLIWVIFIGSVLIIVFTAGASYTVMRHTQGLVSAQREVTALNANLEDRVQERTAALSRANEEIPRIAYIVSHDLRSPLVNIMGFTSELEASVATLRDYVAGDKVDAKLAEAARTTVSEDVPEAVRFIRASTGKMDGLINAILELSREGRRALNREAVDLDRVFAQAAASLKHQLDEAGAEIVLPVRSPQVVTDRLALEQVIGNVLDNAVKYLVRGRPGRIVVVAEEGAGRVRIDISDNGRGIAAQDRERIFELFRRAGQQDRPGEGIGLAHVRSLVRRLGGDIAASSELGRGSTFQIDLPIRPKYSDPT
jgi:signal transduction histidine kinase